MLSVWQWILYKKCMNLIRNKNIFEKFFMCFFVQGMECVVVVVENAMVIGLF